MLAHILHAGVRALAASVLLGTILVYAVGGLESSLARPLIGIIAIGFFVFWIVFAFLFGRLPKPERRGVEIEVGGSMSWARGGRRDPGERGEGDGEGAGGEGAGGEGAGGEGGGGDGGD